MKRMAEGGRTKGGVNNSTLRSRDEAAKMFKVGVKAVQQGLGAREQCRTANRLLACGRQTRMGGGPRALLGRGPALPQHAGHRS